MYVNIATNIWNFLQPTDSKNNSCRKYGNTLDGFCIHTYNSRNIISWFLLPLCSNLTATLEQNHCQQNGIKTVIQKKYQIHYLTPLCNVIMYQAGLKPILRRRWKKCCTYSHAETIFFDKAIQKKPDFFYHLSKVQGRSFMLCESEIAKL